METRVGTLESQFTGMAEWRKHVDDELTSAQQQRKKLFAEVGEVKKQQARTQKTLDDHADKATERDNETQGKLDMIVKAIVTHDERDEDHDQKLQQAAKEREEMKAMMKAEFAKKLPLGASIVGALGFLVNMLLDHLPEIGEFIVFVWKGLQQ